MRAHAFAVLLLATPALAQDANDSAAAEALFDQARDLMAKGRYSEACEKFAASQKLDPAGGTLLNLGECYVKVGRTASAWATFREAEALAHRQNRVDRELYARQRALEIAQHMSKLTLLIPPAIRVDGLVIRRDGEVVDPAMLGVAIPIDPGVHRIEIEAPQKKPITRFVDVRSDNEVVTLESLDDLSLPAPPPQPPAIVSPPILIPLAPDSSQLNVQRTVGLVIGGIGLGSLAASGILGLVALGKNNAAKDLGCDATSCPTQEGVDRTNEALSFAGASTVMLILGGGMFVAGGVMAITARSKSVRKPTVAFVPSISGGGLAGTF